MKPIELTNHQWFELRAKLQSDYPASFTMIRSTMRDKLGFTPRTHKTWTALNGFETVVHLDFFDEAKRTMFMLKYSEYFNSSRN